jgi:hypothetical protein
VGRAGAVGEFDGHEKRNVEGVARWC